MGGQGSGNPRWVKGVSGNPKGKPKKDETFTGILNKVMREKSVEWKTKSGKKKLISGKEATARKLLELAVKGDVGAIKYIGDRTDGKPNISEKPVEDAARDIVNQNRARYDALFGIYGGGIDDAPNG